MEIGRDDSLQELDARSRQDRQLKIQFGDVGLHRETSNRNISFWFFERQFKEKRAQAD